mgnify:CR=1 FL=1
MSKIRIIKRQQINIVFVLFDYDFHIHGHPFFNQKKTDDLLCVFMGKKFPFKLNTFEIEKEKLSRNQIEPQRTVKNKKNAFNFIDDINIINQSINK